MSFVAADRLCVTERSMIVSNKNHSFSSCQYIANSQFIVASCFRFELTPIYSSRGSISDFWFVRFAQRPARTWQSVELCSQFTSIVNLVLINSKGYVQRVELTQASAPARSDEVGRSLGLISLWRQEFLGRIKQTAPLVD